MQKIIFITILLITLISCSEKNGKAEAEKENVLEIKVDKSKTVERFIPELIETKTQESVVKNENLKVLITTTSLKTFVVDEYIKKGIKHIDKYRDNEIHLRIVKNSKPIVDTIFHKELFNNQIQNSFLKTANLIGYWFIKSENGKLIFFMIISNPDMKIGYDFNHDYDIKAKKFDIKIVESYGK